jgi:glycosyltransferase involved in cell wall biosynthesis
MRILYFTDTRAIGGAERNLADLANGAAEAGHEVLIAAPQAELVAWLAREVQGARAVRAFSDAYHDARSPTGRARVLLGMLPRIARALRRLAPDVVHVNNGGFPGSDLCRIVPAAAKLARVPDRIMTVHSNPWARDRLSNARIQALGDRLVWSSVNAVISPSEAVARGLQARRGMSASLSRTIYYGVPQARHDRTDVERLHRRLAPAGELLVGMVSARPVAEKGYDVLVDALASAPPGVRGVLVGPCPEGIAAQACARRLGDRLAFEGARRNVGDYYAAFDVLVVPSTAEECMPLVILEAASVGTPVFGSRLSGIPEAIADGVSGRLFVPGAAEELAELIAEAARHRSRLARMGRAARERWRERFELGTMVGATLDLYDAGDQGTRYTASR